MAAGRMVDTKRRRSLIICGCLASTCIVSAVLVVGSAYLLTDFKKQSLSGLQTIDIVKTMCEGQCMADGSETLPRGIVARTSDLEMRQLWGRSKKKKSKSPMNLLAIAVGLKQKGNVDKIVKKFAPTQFVVMLFHYDGKVDAWKDLEWSSHAIHVSAINQTKWWFAKRFLHPDVVAQYAYVFLWDEDIGVETFRVGRYLSIIKKEGLQISQPAIDPDKSDVHHKITARETSSKVHRRTINLRGAGRRCYEDSSEPPCTGWVEMMAPVFSRESWRCAWYMIQNDLIHAWGLDFQLGYCAQGNRTANIGIVDSEYVIHYGLPTLGGSAVNKTPSEAQSQVSKTSISHDKGFMVPSTSEPSDGKNAVRKRSYVELENFKNRWKKAVREDTCWNDPFSSQ